MYGHGNGLHVHVDLTPSIVGKHQAYVLCPCMQVQAIAKQDSASGSSLFLILHVANPKCGVPDFLDWLPNSPNPVRPQAADIMLAKTMSLRSQRPALVRHL